MSMVSPRFMQNSCNEKFGLKVNNQRDFNGSTQFLGMLCKSRPPMKAGMFTKHLIHTLHTFQFLRVSSLL